ncbi:MAG TPA: tetratricopeptide repeat protein [Pyrinomonadaceae bacterium]
MLLGGVTLLVVAALFLNPPTIVVYLISGLLPITVAAFLLLAIGRARGLNRRDVLFAFPASVFLIAVAAVFVYYSPGRLSARLASARQDMLPNKLLSIGQPLPTVSEMQSENVVQMQNSLEVAEQLGIARSPELYVETGLLNFSVKNYKAAEAQFRKAIQLDKSGESKPTIAVAYNNLGVTLRRLDRLDESLEAFSSALNISAERETTLTAELNKARAYRIKGRYDEATSIADNVLASPELPGYWRGSALRLKGVIEEDKGEYEEALRYYGLAAKFYEAGGHLQELAITHNNIGNVFINWNRGAADVDAAIRNHEMALKLNQQVGSDDGQGDSYAGLAYDYMKKGDLDKALGYAERALELHRKAKAPLNEAAILDTIGDIYHRKGDTASAIFFFNDSLAVAREVGNRYGQAVTLRNLATVYVESKDCERARPLLLESQAIFEQIPHKKEAEEVRKLYRSCATAERP